MYTFLYRGNYQNYENFPIKNKMNKIKLKNKLCVDCKIKLEVNNCMVATN